MLDPNPDKPELKIEDLLMSLRSVLFKSEDIPIQFFCIESKEITFKDLKAVELGRVVCQYPVAGACIIHPIEQQVQ